MDPATLSSAGFILQAGGVLNSAVGSFYAAKSQRYQLASQASSAEFQADIARLNARMAGAEAERALLAGERQIGRYTMQAGQQKAAATASLAARGVTAGVGSAAETMATADVIKEIDSMTINANAVRQAEAMRMQRVSFLNQAAMSDVTARNLMRMRKTISPEYAAMTSLLGGAGQVASSYATNLYMQGK